jgi:hypothetical protein
MLSIMCHQGAFTLLCKQLYLPQGSIGPLFSIVSIGLLVISYSPMKILSANPFALFRKAFWTRLVKRSRGRHPGQT